ncbi:hypothetical protein N7520_003187 [Penicillium odoratum]|uniref:uncharacterized protein n=1 Tax=Penicillium odoratum TaxID=1167516 RepID=UPI00254824C8|nr:uncharacterized protein N7520_003187 [Penicillium odoratum]KAJ5772658.1 hypothetical protein N7520_003187 [Penicillium odoratum]
MSVTTTSTATSLSVLADYELHHSEERSTSTPAPSVSQPVDWPTDHRRMPAYRPANHHLDYNERTAGTSVPEFVFIQVMLHGVWLNAAASRLWRFTGGRINNKIFHYEVGGEW